MRTPIDLRPDRGMAADAGEEIPAGEGMMRRSVREEPAVVHAQLLLDIEGAAPRVVPREALDIVPAPKR